MTNRDDRPMVSVIMIVYNQEKWVGEAIESVLAQEVDFPFEIVISDDCSSDRTAEICRAYAERHPHLIRFIANARNKGLVRNYYDTIRASRGKYIADLAGDDVWIDPHKLSRQYNWLESHPEVVLCHGAWQYLRPGNKTEAAEGFAQSDHIKTAGKGELTSILCAHQSQEWFVHLCTAMYRKEAVIELMEDYPEYFVSDLPCEDYQLLCLLSTKGAFTRHPELVLNYRVGHPSASSADYLSKYIRFTCRVIELSLRLCETLTVDRAAMRRYFKETIHHAFMEAFVAKDKKALMEVCKIIDTQAPRWKVSPKTTAARVSASNALTWNIALGIRKLLKKKHKN